MALPDFIRSYLPEDGLDVRWVTSGTGPDLAAAPRFILVMGCMWSPHTQFRLRFLAETLPSIVGQEVPVIVFDIDDIPDDYWDQNGTALHSHGWGEVHWIKGGRILRSLKESLGNNPELIRTYSQELLED